MEVKWFARIRFYHMEKQVRSYDFELKQGKRVLTFDDNLKIELHIRTEPSYFAEIYVLEGEAKEISLSIVCKWEDWNNDNYILIPGAVYNGNRFSVYECTYPPFRYGLLSKEKDAGDMITDIPHLERYGGKIHFHAGDMAAPMVGIVCSHSGLILKTEQKFGDCESGIELLEENTSLEAVFSVPCVKQSKYRIAQCGFKSDDRAIVLKKGEKLNLSVTGLNFKCDSIQTLFDYIFSERWNWYPTQEIKKMFPFSNCAKILEEKFNCTDWVDEYGYYSMGSRPGYKKAWLLGWPGMMMYPMLINGNTLTQQRALRTIDYILDVTQAPTGFFYTSAGGSKCFGDCFDHRDWKHWGLIRRNCDALFYLAKCMQVIIAKKIPYDTLRLKTAIQKCADAFVRLYKNNGQIGQFVDMDTGKILIEHTCSGALSVGALALCGQIFSNEEYLKIAEQIASNYYDQYVSKGITNGGPGEILQAPDSESAYGMVAGFVTLYEVTKNVIWLSRSEEIAKQFATWCMPYHYTFPADSEFGRLGMQTTGTVFANVQNKHSAPGICTHSGIELLQLYRFTGDEKYLQLIKEIARTIPQFLSRNERPIGTRKGSVLGHGWMNERVNTSDWEGTDNIGTVESTNCWCSVTLMMTCAEIPGVYISRENHRLVAIDHIDAIWEKDCIALYNPTDYDADVTIWDDYGEDLQIPALQYKHIFCPAKETVKVELK